MKKYIKSVLSIAAVSAASVLSMSAAAETTMTYPWLGTPFAYTNVAGCTWTYTGSYGGTWGSQFNYVANGACPYSKMQVNRSAGSSTANVVLN